ncbi:hypothetical protein AB0H42_30825 [Nocardia sp. NPDC050799]|uniref:hypothetical protein n=1 Tax=Nocardia sp. NPDC050799 TaxID=3154842 RepID=UPI0033D45CFF
MAGEIELDPGELLRQSARLAELGAQVGRACADLRDSLDFAHGCWGDDYMGDAFAKDFTPNAEQLLAGQQAMADGLRDTAAAIRSAADRFAMDDRESGRRITQTPGPGDETRFASARDTEPSLPRTVTEPQAAPDRRAPAESATPSWTEPGIGAAPPETAPTGVSNSPAARVPPRSDRPSAPATQAPGTQASPILAQPRGTGPVNAPSRSNPSRWVSAPGATGLPAPRNPAPAGPNRVDTGPRAESARPTRLGSGGSPWSERSPNMPGRQPPVGANPQNGSPPPGSQPPRGNGRRPANERPTENLDRSPVSAWLAQMLVRSHGVEVAGFDLPDLAEQPVREFAAAVDRVLTDYPMIVVDRVAVAELGDDAEPVQWRQERRISATIRSIILDRRAACTPGGPVTAASSDIAAAQPDNTGGVLDDTADARSSDSARAQPEDAPREQSGGTAVGESGGAVDGEPAAIAAREPDGTAPAVLDDPAAGSGGAGIYAETVRALGPALDSAGGGAAGAGARRALVADYMRAVEGRYTTLAELVRGYRQWRAELAGATDDAGRFDVQLAIRAGFAEVVLRGGEASAPAQTLHALLVDAAHQRD